MGSAVTKAPPRPPVRAGFTRVCVAGFALSHHTNRAGKIARAVGKAKPDEYETWFFFDSKAFRGKDRFTGATDGNPEAGGFLATIKTELSKEDQDKYANFKTSPFCWLEMPEGKKVVLGGRDGLSAWAKAQNFGPAVDKECVEPSAFESRVDCTPGTAPTE